jgi:hypothetical protein
MCHNGVVKERMEMDTYKVRVRISGQDVQAFFVDANSAAEATELATAGVSYKSIVGVSIVKKVGA